MYGLVAGGFCTWRRTQEKQNVLRDTLKYESNISPGTNAGPVYSVAFKCQRSRPFKLCVTLLYLMRKRNCHYSQSAIMTNVRIWTLLWTRSWNQPVLSNEGKYSCSRKQGGAFGGVYNLCMWGIHWLRVTNITIAIFLMLKVKLSLNYRNHCLFVSTPFHSIVLKTHSGLHVMKT